MLSNKKRTQKLAEKTRESFVEHANNLDLDYYEDGMFLHDGGTIPEDRKQQIYKRATAIAATFPYPWNNFYVKNIDLALRETAAQLNDAAIVRQPVVNMVGEEFALLALEMYPNIQHTSTYKGKNDTDVQFAEGGMTDDRKQELYKKWKQLVNMSTSELRKFYQSDEGKEAGLSKEEAGDLGINYGRESARWIMKMKETKREEWTANMWGWAGKQINFISRMKGNSGPLYDDKGNKTRKHTSLLIWGHNPVKKMEEGGMTQESKIKKHIPFYDKLKKLESEFIETGRKRVDEYYEQDDPNYNQRLVLQMKYSVLWSDIDSNSNPDEKKI